MKEKSKRTIRHLSAGILAMVLSISLLPMNAIKVQAGEGDPSLHGASTQNSIENVTYNSSTSTGAQVETSSDTGDWTAYIDSSADYEVTGGTWNAVVGGLSRASGDEYISVTNNTLTISGGTVSSVVGGQADSSTESNNTVNKNTVNISGGTVSSVVGGQAVSGTVSDEVIFSYAKVNNNMVNISGGTVIGSVCGGYADCDDCEIKDNMVNISGTADLENAEVYGYRIGDDAEATALGGNSLYIADGWSGKIKKISSFDEITNNGTLTLSGKNAEYDGIINNVGSFTNNGTIIFDMTDVDEDEVLLIAGSYSYGTYKFADGQDSSYRFDVRDGNGLYAVKIKTYTVQFDGNGSTSGSMDEESMTVGIEAALTANAYERTGYDFWCWNTEKDGRGTSYGNKDTVMNLSTTEGDTVILFAQWEAHAYSVKFDGNGSTSGNMDDESMYVGIEATLTDNAYARIGYSFSGWNTKEDGSGKSYGNKATVMNLSTTDDDTVTLYAQWEANTYTVKFDGNGSTSGKMKDTSMTVDKEAALTANAYVRTGYSFAGWNTNADGTGDAYADKATVKNLSTTEGAIVTLYAQWTYTVKFNGNGSTSGKMKDMSMTVDKEAALTANAYVRTGYSFAGWNTKADGSGTSYKNKATVKNLSTTEDATVTLYAQWTPIYYYIEFNSNGGSGTMNKSLLKYDETLVIPSNTFTKSNCTFTGWNTDPKGLGGSYTDGQKIRNLTTAEGSTVTLYAQWKTIVQSYTVKFDANGGSGSMSAQAIQTSKSTALTKNAFKKTGYTFKGWNTKANGKGTAYKDAEKVENIASAGKSITLYAQWKINTYKITYNLNGGKNNSKNPSSYNVTTKDITLQNPTRTGYTFKGWYTDKNFTKKVTAIKKGSTGNVSLFAKWAAISYTVKFNANGGSGKMKNQSMTYDKNAKLTKNSFTRKNYTFLGWSTDKKATKAKYKNAAEVKNLTSKSGATVTLYAIWKKK